MFEDYIATERKTTYFPGHFERKKQMGLVI